MSASATSECLCHGTGWAPFMDGEIERVRRCACWLEKQRQWAADVPKEFQLARIENYQQISGNRIAIAAAKKFLSGARDLMLWGGVGSGKTRLACSILNACFAKDQSGLFVAVPMMLRRLQPSTSDERQQENQDYEDRLMKVEPIVCLDDLGAEREKATDFTRRTMFMIAEERHNRGLRTIWTSNKSPDQLAAMHDDDRLASRLAGWCEVVELTCADQRINLVGSGR